MIVKLNSGWLAALIMAGMVLMGCSTPPPQPASQISTAQGFDIPKSKVWTAVVGCIALDYPITSSDQTSGLLTTGAVAIPVGNWNINKAILKWVNPPGSNLLIGYSGLRVALNILVTEPAPNATRVDIHAHYEVFQGPLGAQQGSWVPATSNGYLEQQILQKISSQLGK